MSYIIDEAHLKSTGPDWKSAKHSPVVIIRFITISYFWLCVSFLYYGIALNVGSLRGSLYLNALIMNLVHLPANIFVYKMVNCCLGRHYALILMLLFCSVSHYTDITFNRTSYSRTTFTMLGKLAVDFAFFSVIIATSELFPRNIRSTTFSVDIFPRYHLL